MQKIFHFEYLQEVLFSIWVTYCGSDADTILLYCGKEVIIKA